MDESASLFESTSPQYASSSFPAPRYFQASAHEALRAGRRAGHKNQLLMSPTGSGKTYLGLRIAQEALIKGKRAVFVCDRTTLIDQTSETADRYGLSAHGVLQAQHWRTNKSMPFQIASAQTLARREWPDADVIIIDECFPAGTMISTPSGPRPIELIESGDRIHNACGVSHVYSVYAGTRRSTVKVRLSDGTEFRCTPDHPIFTDRGWVEAGSLAVGAKLYRHEDVRALWHDDAPSDDSCRDRSGTARGGEVVQGAAFLQQILLSESVEPDELCGQQRKDGGDSQGHRPSSKCAWREWQGAVSCAAHASLKAISRVEDGACGKDISERIDGLPASLQIGSCSASGEDCNRAGRRKPWRIESSAARSEEGRIASQPRVESVTAEEFGSAIPVWNLRVSQHPSYFADGVLVHNCHTQLTAWTEHIGECRASVIGLSATPFSRGLGKLFTNLVNAATMHDLTQAGVLVPMRVFSCAQIDMRGAKTSGGEWTDGAAAERGMDIIGDVVSEWQRFGENRKTIVFGSTIAHCEEVVRQFNEAGVMAACFTSETTPAERKSLLDEYRRADASLRVLVSVEALAKGFDVPDVSCVVDCRPLRKSLSTAIQMWGRGLRASPSTGKVDCLLLDHSGNITRFASDFSDIFYNGLDALDDGEKLDKAVREDGEEEDKGPAKCPACGFQPFAKRCISCGFEVVKQAMVEVLPGEMREVTIGNKKLAENHADLWAQISTYVMSHGKLETANQRAYYLFKDMAGTEPPRHWKANGVPPTVITRNVMNRIAAKNIAFARAKQKSAGR